MMDVHKTPLNQELVRGLLTNSNGTNIASFSFSKEFPNVVSILTTAGHRFDTNFTVGLKRFIEICKDEGVHLQYEACRPMKAVELPKARDVEEALDQQDKAVATDKALEAPVSPEVTEGRQTRVKGQTAPKKTKAEKKAKAAPPEGQAA
jgi:hypothetical protein